MMDPETQALIDRVEATFERALAGMSEPIPKEGLEEMPLPVLEATMKGYQLMAEAITRQKNAIVTVWARRVSANTRHRVREVGH